MKKLILLLAILYLQPLVGEYYGGVGFGWNTIDENFSSKLATNEDRSGQDHYEVSQSRLAPLVQLGYRCTLCNDWGVGLCMQWKYLNYKTPNVSSSRGQILPNATFSSINIFGPEVLRDFTSKTRLNNEILCLGFMSKQAMQGHVYIGVGPAILTATNRLYVSSVHTPNGIGDHLISTSVKSYKTMWGGAAQVRYQHQLHTNVLFNINYTYLQTGTNHFSNTVNAMQLNGFINAGSTTLILKRAIAFSAQALVSTVNVTY